MTDIVLRIGSVVGQGLQGISVFRKEIQDTRIATGDLRETWKVTGAEITIQQRKQIEDAKATIAAYREQIAAAKELSSSYKRGSEERQLATKLEIDLQRKLQATLGETAAVAGRAGAAAGRSAEGSEARGLLSGTKALGGRAAAFGSTAFLGGAVVGLEAKSAIDAVRAYQQSQVQLVQSMKNVGEAGAGARKEVTQTVDKIEELGFKGTDARESLARLVIATKSTTEADKDLERAANIARARHVDLTTATQILSRVEAGRAAGLSRVGIQTQQVKTYEDQLSNAHIKVTDANRATVKALSERAKAMDAAATKQAALAEIDKRFAGSAEANARTASGASERLAASWEKTQVAVGKVLIPQMTNASNAVADYLNHAIKAGTIEKDAANAAHTLGDAVHYVHETVTAADKITGSFVNTLKLLAAWWATGKAIAFATAVKRDVVAAYDGAAKAITRFRKTAEIENAAVAASSEEAGVAVDAAFPWAAIAQVAVIATLLIIEHWKTVKEWFGVFWTYMQKTGAAAWAGLQDLAKSAVYVILQYATAAIRGVLEVASHLPFVGGKAKAALNDINDYISKWKPDFRNVITAFRNGGQAAGEAFSLSAQKALQAAATGATSTGGVGAAAGSSPNRAGTSGGVNERNIGAAGAGRVYGASGYITAGLAAVEKLAGGHVNDDFATSGHATNSFHYKGEAADLAPDPDVWNRLYANRAAFAELFGPTNMPGGGGLYHFGVRFYDAALQAEHQNHIHVAYTGGPTAIDKMLKGGGGTTPKAPPAPNSDSFAAAIAAAKSGAATGTKVKGLTAAGLISIDGQIDALVKSAPAKGQRDQIEKDAIAHIQAIKDDLHVGMSATDLAKDRVSLAKWGKNLRDEIAKNAKEATAAATAHKKALAKAAAEVKQAWQDGWTVDVNSIDRQIGEQWSMVQQTFDRQTQAHVTTMQRAFTSQMQTFDRETQAHLTKMQRDFQKQMTAFDAETQKGLDALNVVQTPEEKALSDFEAQRTAADTADRLATLKKTLGDAQTALAQGSNPLATGGGGVVGNLALLTPDGWVYKDQTGSVQTQSGQDLASLQQAVVDAQKALDNELADEKDSALKAAADASRTAADAATKIQQDSYQAQRDDQKQALQDAEDVNEQQYQDDRDARKQHLQDLEDLDEQHYSDTRATQWQALQDSHDDQVSMFDADLKLWETALESKQKTWAQFLKWLQANPVSKGINGGDISDPTGFKIPSINDLVPSVSGAPGGRATIGKAIAQAAGGIVWRPTYMRGEQGSELVVPLTSQRGAETMRQLVAAAVQAGGGGNAGGQRTIVYGTFLGATEKQVGRALEGLVTPQQARVVRYNAPR